MRQPQTHKKPLAEELPPTESSEENRAVLGWYAFTCAQSPAALVLCGALSSAMMFLVEPDDEDFSDCVECEVDPWSSPRPPKLDTKRLRAIRKVLEAHREPPTADKNLIRNLGYACEEFGFDPIEGRILLLLLRYYHNADLEQFADRVTRVLRAPSHAIARMIGADPMEVRPRIAFDGRLVRSGVLCLNFEDGSNCLAGTSGPLQLSYRVRTVMRNYHASQLDWTKAVIGAPLTTSLTPDDFAHLASSAELAARVLAGAVTTKAEGVNILLHGPVGTGKTEFSKVLAAQINCLIWSVGEAAIDGDEPSRSGRLGSLRVVKRLLASRGRALILFDEAEDLLTDRDAESPRSGGSGRGSKVYINRLLEQNQVPVIWTCNSLAQIDPAVVRRMTMAIEIKIPTAPIRARIWERSLRDANIELPAAAVTRLSKQYAAPAAVSANAVRAASLCGGGEAEIEIALKGVMNGLGISPSVNRDDSAAFDLGLVNCAVDLTDLVERLVRPAASRRWSLCLNGAPGTGKSQFARYLAERLGMEVMQQRASDLISCYVGQSERQIAAAFESARTQGALLIIDEAESLLADRRDAVRHYEVSEVNEMLTWMENHPLPFICTTNLIDRLDHASLRRFTIKLRFDPLTPTQAADAFERFFGTRAPCLLPDGLSLGDFATVRRKLDLLGPAGLEVLVAWLDEEATAKGARCELVGFVTGRNRAA